MGSEQDERGREKVFMGIVFEKAGGYQREFTSKKNKEIVPHVTGTCGNNLFFHGFVKAKCSLANGARK